MRTTLTLLFACLAAVTSAQNPAQNPAPKPPLKITPGKVIVPTDAMRRPWGELISLDLKTRTGSFRNESNDEVTPFIVMPYAELLHHAAFGDLEDFRVGERAIFRLHQDDEGRWVYLTYIQDEMNFLNGHKEYYWVDRLDAAKGEIEFTQANADKSFVRGKGLILETDAETRYWKDGKPATFADIRVGDKLRTKSHGLGQGKHHRCWEVFLDDASLTKFQDEQKEAHRKRMLEQGLPGYIDEATEKSLTVTLFQEGREPAKELKPGQAIAAAPAGVDRVAGRATEGTVREVRAQGNLHVVRIELAAEPAEKWIVGGLVRVKLSSSR